MRQILVLTLLGLALGSLTVMACGSEESSPASTVNQGTAKLALTTKGASGATYRLLDAEFVITQGDTQSEVTRFATSEVGNSPYWSREFEPGGYQIELKGNWLLMRNGVIVQAELVSPNPLAFDVIGGNNTYVPIRFRTNQEPIDFGTGATVGVEVDDCDGGLCNDGGGSYDDGGVEGGWTDPDASYDSGWTDPDASYDGDWTDPDASYDGGWTDPDASYDGDWTDPDASYDGDWSAQDGG